MNLIEQSFRHFESNTDYGGEKKSKLAAASKQTLRGGRGFGAGRQGGRNGR